MTIKLGDNSKFNTQEERMAAMRKRYGGINKREIAKKKKEADRELARMIQVKKYGHVLTEEEMKQNIERRKKELQLN